MTLTNLQEAMRISTPPLGEFTADGKPRSFFSSLTAPDVDGTVALQEAGARRESTERSRIHHQALTRSQPREW